MLGVIEVKQDALIGQVIEEILLLVDIRGRVSIANSLCPYERMMAQFCRVRSLLQDLRY